MYALPEDDQRSNGSRTTAQERATYLLNLYNCGCRIKNPNNVQTSDEFF
jgi:hypothetical protein